MTPTRAEPRVPQLSKKPDWIHGWRRTGSTTYSRPFGYYGTAYIQSATGRLRRAPHYPFVAVVVIEIVRGKCKRVTIEYPDPRL